MKKYLYDPIRKQLSNGIKTYGWGKPDKRLLKDNKVLCPQCERGEGKLDKTYGVLPCQKCQQKGAKIKITKYPEFVPERIKDDRKEYFGDLLQPYRDGKLSKEFADAYPSKVKKMATKEEINAARDTWGDLPGHSQWRMRNPGI